VVVTSLSVFGRQEDHNTSDTQFLDQDLFSWCL